MEHMNNLLAFVIMSRMHHSTSWGDRTPCVHIIVQYADNMKFIHVGPFVYTINGQAMNIKFSWNLVKKLLHETIAIVNNQLLFTLQMTWINKPIFDGKIIDKCNEDVMGYFFLLNDHSKFHLHVSNLVMHLFNDQHTYGILVKGINDDESIIWNHNALAMWARIVDYFHIMSFLLMHFIVGGWMHGEKYQSYLIHNMEHYEQTFY